MKFKNRLNYSDRSLLEWSKRDLDGELFKQEFERRKTKINWGIFVEHAEKSHLAGYFLQNIEKAEINLPQEIKNPLVQYQQRLFTHHLKILEVLLEFNIELKKTGIQHVFLKGIDLTIRGYSSLKVRQISDIDILVHAKDLNILQNALINLDAKVRHMVFKSKKHQLSNSTHAPIQAKMHGISIDVHTSLFGSTFGFKMETTELLSSREKHAFHGQLFHLLDEKNAALFCYLHAFKHLYFGSMLKVALIHDFSYYHINGLSEYAENQSSGKEFNKMIRFEKEILQNKNQVDFMTHTLFRFLSQQRITWIESIILTLRKVSLLNLNRNSPGLIFYSIFPNKIYLNTFFGPGSYTKTWLKRYINFFNLFFTVSKK
jgi:hypothetical protein